MPSAPSSFPSAPFSSSFPSAPFSSSLTSFPTSSSLTNQSASASSSLPSESAPASSSSPSFSAPVSSFSNSESAPALSSSTSSASTRSEPERIHDGAVDLTNDTLPDPDPSMDVSYTDDSYHENFDKEHATALKKFKDFYQQGLLTPPLTSGRQKDDVYFKQAIDLLMASKRGNLPVALPTHGKSYKLGFEDVGRFLPDLFLNDASIVACFGLGLEKSGKWKKHKSGLKVSKKGTWVVDFQFNANIWREPKYSYQPYERWAKRALSKRVKSIKELNNIVFPFCRPHSHFAGMRVNMKKQRICWFDPIPGSTYFSEDFKNTALEHVKLFLTDVENTLNKQNPFHDWKDTSLKTLKVQKQWGVDCGVSLVNWVEDIFLARTVARPEPTSAIESAKRRVNLLAVLLQGYGSLKSSSTTSKQPAPASSSSTIRLTSSSARHSTLDSSSTSQSVSASSSTSVSASSSTSVSALTSQSNTASNSSSVFQSMPEYTHNNTSMIQAPPIFNVANELSLGFINGKQTSAHPLPPTSLFQSSTTPPTSLLTSSALLSDSISVLQTSPQSTPSGIYPFDHSAVREQSISQMTARLVRVCLNFLPSTYTSIQYQSWVYMFISNRIHWNNVTTAVFINFTVWNPLTLDVYSNLEFVKLMDKHIFNGMNDDDYAGFVKAVRLLNPENNKYQDNHGLIVLQQTVLNASTLHKLPSNPHDSVWDDCFSYVEMASELVATIAEKHKTKEDEMKGYNNIKWSDFVEEGKRAPVYQNMVAMMNCAGRIQKHSLILPAILNFTVEQNQLKAEYMKVVKNEDLAVFYVCQTPDVNHDNLMELEKLNQFLVDLNIQQQRLLEFWYDLPDNHLKNYHFTGPVDYTSNARFDLDVELQRYKASLSNSIQELPDSQEENRYLSPTTT